MQALLHYLLAIGLCGLLAVGCTTTQVVTRPDTTRFAASLKPGDQVDCTLRNGATMKFEIVRIESAALVGRSERAELRDVTQLKVKRFSPGKTIALAALLVAAGFLGEGISHLGALGYTAAP